MLGKCAGGAVYAPVTTDFVVATKDSYMFVTGPDVIRSVTGEDITMEELGSAEKQMEYGNVTTWPKTSTRHSPMCAATVLPPHLLQRSRSAGPHRPGTGGDGLGSVLNTIIPDSDNASYDVMDVLVKIFDDGDVLEVTPGYGANVVTAFARVDGRPVGVIANQPKVLSVAWMRALPRRRPATWPCATPTTFPLCSWWMCRLPPRFRGGEERCYSPWRQVPGRHCGCYGAEGDGGAAEGLRRWLRRDGL
ncbi:MAG: carboxyl transferase domain-containing protein [Lawsonella clevelandensis]